MVLSNLLFSNGTSSFILFEFMLNKHTNDVQSRTLNWLGRRGNLIRSLYFQSRYEEKLIIKILMEYFKK